MIEPVLVLFSNKGFLPVVGEASMGMLPLCGLWGCDESQGGLGLSVNLGRS